MSENTKIEWCDHTFNPWVGCTKISPACDHCYAEGWAKRSGQVVWSGERKRTSIANWRLPLKWNREAEASGTRPKVFCASLADVFDNEVDPVWFTDLFELIEATPNLDWLLLTKRIGNVAKMVADGRWFPTHWPNVWIGATICNQAEADRDIPKLLAVPAAKRFLSMEPLLGPVDLSLCNCDKGSKPGPGGAGGVTCPRCNGAGGCTVDWVIVGGGRDSIASIRKILNEAKTAGSYRSPDQIKSIEKYIDDVDNMPDGPMKDARIQNLYMSNYGEWEARQGSSYGRSLPMMNERGATR